MMNTEMQSAYLCCCVQNDLQFSASSVRKHIESTIGKLVTLRDIHNIRRRMAKADWGATVDALEQFQQSDANALVDVLVRGGTNWFEMLLLQTGQMRDNIRSFPEIIQLDSTYALNQAGLPLYAVLVEDANGLSRLGALILIRGDAAISLQTMLSCVKEHNPDLDRTRVVIVDKDFAEAPELAEVLPDAQIRLSAHRVLQTVRKEVLKCIADESQHEVYGIMHSLVYARSSTKFAEEWTRLRAHAEFARYVTTHWLPTKSLWVYYEQECHVNLGNGPNDSIDSHFGTIRRVVDQKRRMSDCIRLLVAVLHSPDARSRFRPLVNRHEMTYRSCMVSDVDGYFDVCTSYAAKNIDEQLELARADRYMTWSENDSVVIVTTIQSRDQYFVSERASRCSCSFNRTMLLPCRHILLVRNQSGMSLVDASIVDDRWKPLAEQSHPAPPSSEQVLALTSLANSPPLSKSEKYSAACKQLEKLSVAMSEMGTRDFVSVTHFVDRVFERCEAGKRCILVEDDVEDDEAAEIVPVLEPSDTLEQPVEIVPIPGPSDTLEQAAALVLDEEVNPEDEPNDTSSVPEEPPEELANLDESHESSTEAAETTAAAASTMVDLSLLRSVTLPLSMVRRRRLKSAEKSSNANYFGKGSKRRFADDGAGMVDVTAMAVSDPSEIQVTVDVAGGPLSDVGMEEYVAVSSNGTWVRPRGRPRGQRKVAGAGPKRVRVDAAEEISDAVHYICYQEEANKDAKSERDIFW